jgi:hypothetical protein
MGLIITVYRDANDSYDCTKNGVSKRFSRLCVTNVDGPFDPSEDCPPVKLVENPFNTVAIVPDELSDKATTFGGNYAATSDSRFGDAIKKITGTEFHGAVAIHDREFD